MTYGVYTLLSPNAISAIGATFLHYRLVQYISGIRILHNDYLHLFFVSGLLISRCQKYIVSENLTAGSIYQTKSQPYWS